MAKRIFLGGLPLYSPDEKYIFLTPPIGSERILLDGLPLYSPNEQLRGGLSLYSLSRWIAQLPCSPDR